MKILISPESAWFTDSFSTFGNQKIAHRKKVRRFLIPEFNLIICSLEIQAPRKLIDSGCGSSAEQVAMSELEKLLVAHTRYEKCQWLIKPRLNGKTPSYPVIRLAQGVTPSLVF